MQLKVGNNLAGMYPDVFTAVSDVDVGGSATLASFGLADTTGTVFSSTALPTSLDLGKFDVGKFTLGSGQEQEIFEGVITLQSVPEPSSVILLGFAALWVRVLCGGECFERGDGRDLASSVDDVGTVLESRPP